MIAKRMVRKIYAFTGKLYKLQTAKFSVIISKLNQLLYTKIQTQKRNTPPICCGLFLFRFLTQLQLGRLLRLKVLSNIFTADGRKNQPEFVVNVQKPHNR
jgi:hypothetical protein